MISKSVSKSHYCGSLLWLQTDHRRLNGFHSNQQDTSGASGWQVDRQRDLQSRLISLQNQFLYLTYTAARACDTTGAVYSPTLQHISGVCVCVCVWDCTCIWKFKKEENMTGILVIEGHSIGCGGTSLPCTVECMYPCSGTSEFDREISIFAPSKEACTCVKLKNTCHNSSYQQQKCSYNNNLLIFYLAELPESPCLWQPCRCFVIMDLKTVAQNRQAFRRGSWRGSIVTSS